MKLSTFNALIGECNKLESEQKLEGLSKLYRHIEAMGKFGRFLIRLQLWLARPTEATSEAWWALHVHSTFKAMANVNHGIATDNDYHGL